MRGLLKENVKISSRKLMAVTILPAGTLAWVFFSYYIFEDIFKSITTDLFWVYTAKALFFSFGAFSAIAGSMIGKRINFKMLLWAWITLGVLTTASLAVFQGTLFSLLSSILLGVSLGLGFPSSLAFLADCTVVEERGRVAGVMFLETFAIVTLAYVAMSVFSLGPTGLILLAVALRSTSYLSLALDPCKKEDGRESSWKTVFEHRNFVFYLIPWLMFNIASGLIAFVWAWLPQSPDYQAALRIGSILHFLLPGVFALVSGVVADRFGRKQPIIVGMIMLGVSFAFLGVSTSPLSVLVYLTISGIAWGFLMVVYAAVPGDMAFSGSKEKFYVLSNVIPFITLLSLPGLADFLGVGIPAVALSSVLSIIVFISVIPVLRATETLPETEIRERKLREHVRKVGELVEESNKTE